MVPSCTCVFRKGQQYDCKWYIPLSDLTFQTIEDSECTPIPQVQDEEVDAMKIKISHLKNDIQREKVRMTDSRTKYIPGLNCIVVASQYEKLRSWL